MSGAKDAGWVVTCPAFTAGPYPTPASAERAMAHIVALGACIWDHAVEKVG